LTHGIARLHDIPQRPKSAMKPGPTPIVTHHTATPSKSALCAKSMTLRLSQGEIVMRESNLTRRGMMSGVLQLELVSWQPRPVR
jgi:hypothetical protein